MAPKNLILFILTLSLGWQSASAQSKQTVTVATELRQLYDLSLLPTYREHTIPGEETSYDRTGGNNDGFGGTYSFVRRNPDSSLVMLDIDGPGVLNRIATPSPTNDTLDIYIDHAAKPTLTICYNDLFNGKVYPFVRPLCDNSVGGFFSYFPITFRSHLMIVCRGHHLEFHQLQYRLFPAGTKVRSFSFPIPQDEKQALDKLASTWAKLTPKQVVSHHLAISPGEPATVTLNKGGRINSLLLDTAGTADLDLQIYWDNDPTPAIDCPVREFFGYAFGKAALHSVFAGEQDGRYYCNFPMPFDERAKIVLVSKAKPGTPKISSALQLSFEPAKRNKTTEGKFYAAYLHHHLTEKDPFHVFLDIKGKGHYVGTLLRGEANFKGLPGFFEGDDTTATDGKFRMHGTGSEDYLNGGWYAVPGRWDHAGGTALSGCLGYGDAPSHTGGYRFFIADKISFDSSFYHAIEHGGDIHGMPADYTSVSFYYCDRGKGAQLEGTP